MYTAGEPVTDGINAGVEDRKQRGLEIAALPHVEKAVRDYVAGASGHISMKAMREQLAKNKDLSTDELGFSVAVVMRRLVEEKVLDVVIRGIGRRDAVYEKSKR